MPNSTATSHPTPGQSSGRDCDQNVAPDSSPLQRATSNSQLTTSSPLAHQQLALARALTTQSPPPPGFDPARLSVAAHALLAKRAASAAKSWPPLARLLGPNFRPLFTPYAQSHPLPPGSTPADDAFHFAQHLATQRLLPLPALRLLARAQLHRGRRLPSLHPTPHGLLLTLPLPFLPPLSLHLKRPNIPRFSP